MTNILSTYVNCSLGGMTSVYRARAVHAPHSQFDYVFLNDRGGLGAYGDLPNIDARLVENERLIPFLRAISKQKTYAELRITSQPTLPSLLEDLDVGRLIYEFHSPIPSIISNELKKLDSSSLDEVWVPSQWAADLVDSLRPKRMHFPITVVPNLTDSRHFVPDGPTVPLPRSGQQIPISWIGRLENSQKNYLDFLRTLRLLPDRFFGLVIYSLEHEPDRLQKFLGDAASLGVLDRIEIYSDVPQPEVAAIHRSVRDAGGAFYSTALSESFGYAVLEARLTKCPVISYDVGPLRAHPVKGIKFLDVGDILGAADYIRSTF